MERRLRLIGIAIALIATSACQRSLEVPDSNSGIQFYHQSGSESIAKVIPLKSGGLVYLGKAEGKALVFVVDPNGSEVFRLLVGGGYDDVFTGAIELNDGNIVVCGRTDSPKLGVTNSFSDALAAKISPSGEIIWLKTFGKEVLEEFNVVAEDPSGNLIFGGMQQVGNFNSYFVKTDAEGNLLTELSIRVGPWHSNCEEVLIGDAGEYIFGGINTSSGGGQGITLLMNYMICFDSSLVGFNWGYGYDEFLRANTPRKGSSIEIYPTPAGYIIASDYEKSLDSTVFQLVITDNTGQILGEKEYTYMANDTYRNFIPMSDGSWLLCGSSKGKGEQSDMSYVVKLNADLEVVWTSRIGDGKQRHVANLATEVLGQIHVAGAVYDDQRSTGKLIRYKLTQDGKLLHEK